ncbi:hypothetical protein BON22_2872 [Cyberlindnera fabianii]|uniref:Uncharacterized protein n=1 Tax=Cyberlindnera fabianii TaxID=36022 RepID=A0A1V2L7U7_CYBFA|nr:hypothetical protein BON22_2872 [Cyberlindnera fabianii]
MELRNDDLQSVALISSSLSDALEQSRAKTTLIEDLIKNIAKSEDINLDEPIRAEPLNSNREVDELERLKSKNLQLILDIQRQEHLARQWDMTIQQNQRLLETIAEWAQTNPTKTQKDHKELTSQAQIAIDTLRESTKLLLEDVKDSEKDIAFMMDIVQELQKLVDQDIQNAEEMTRERTNASKAVNILQDQYVSKLKTLGRWS